MDELRRIRENTGKKNQPDAAIISKDDLERIKAATVVKTKQQIQQEKQQREAEKEAMLAKSKARKQKMQAADQARAQKA